MTGIMAEAQTSVWDGSRELWTRGEGSESSPYRIESAGNLAFLAYMVNKGYETEGLYFVLTTDIDLNGSEDLQWVSVGLGDRWFNDDGCDRGAPDSYYNVNTYFRGHFDGGGHKIYNLYNDGGIIAGLFGYVTSEAEIKNVSVENGYIRDAQYGGGIVGHAGSGANVSITNCSNNADISGFQVGGIVGYGGGKVTNCYNTGSIKGTNAAGGISGTVTAEIHNCFNTGNITLYGGGGGIMGTNQRTTTIMNCYNTGSVTGDGQGIGGIGGIIVKGMVKNCYNVGDVANSQKPAGGVIGSDFNGTADNLVYGAVDPYTEAVWTYPYGYTYAKAPAYSTTATIQGAVGTTLNINISTISPSGIAVGDWITGQGTGTAEVTSISGSTVYLKIVDTTPQTISSYDKFSSDFYQNFPAIKTGDPLTAMFNLGGVLYFMTRRNKYQMYAQTAESWSQSACNAQSGTFSQESLVCDLNYAYYANDKGIYIFDGSSEASLTEKSIQNVYDAIPNKESIVLDLHGNRLYCFYASSGTTNASCLVYNTNLRVWESFDSNTYVSASCGRQSPSNAFVCGHSRIGLIMFGENEDYADMGTPIAFNLETGYLHFGTTSQLKRITKWRPEFAATERPYTCECGYSLDYTDQVRYAFSIDLQKQIPVMTDYVWDNPSDYGVPAIPTIHTTIPQVNGEFYRCQIRYQHIAAHEPVIFRSHTLTIQTQRIR